MGRGEDREARRKTLTGEAGGQSPDLPSNRVKFAHESEREFARLLDFYQIAWEYEPRSFDIAWDQDGRPIQRFTPDFYLPQFDLYVEITTLNQKLVTKKNRKVRLLKELYPDVKIKILYEKDYRNLVKKYGLEKARRAPGPSEEPRGADGSETP